MQQQGSKEEKQHLFQQAANVESTDEKEEKNEHVESMKREWLMLFASSFTWVAVFHATLSLSAVQDTLLNVYNLDNVEYSSLNALVYFFSILSALTTPKLIDKTNLGVSLVITNIFLVVAQILCTCGCLIADYNGTETDNIFYSFLIFFYFGRACVGISLGLSDIVLVALVRVWFGDTKWSVTANMLLASVAINIGAISARSILPILYDVTNLLWQTFFIGLCLSVIGLIGSIVTLVLNKHNKNDHSEYINDYTQIKLFTFETWIVILCFSLTIAQVDTYYAEMTEPFVIYYGLTEIEADIVLSSAPVLAIVLIPIWSILSVKCGKSSVKTASYFFVASVVCIVLSMVVFLVGEDKSSGLLVPSPWISLFFKCLAQQWSWSNGYQLLYNQCSIEMQPLISTVASICYNLITVVEIEIFGVLADWTSSYNASLIMILLVAAIASFLAIRIHINIAIKINNTN